MRFVWQFPAVMALDAVGGNAVNAVENDWLTLVLGLMAAALAVFVYGWVVTDGWCGVPSTGPRRTWCGKAPRPGRAGGS